jgi:hypothetical protein
MPLPPLGITPLTKFRLEMDPNLQLQLTNNPVVRIEVTWSVESSTGAPFPLTLPQPPPAVIRSQQMPPPTPPAIDPTKDSGAEGRIATEELGTRDQVRCICKVVLDNGNTPNVAGTNNAAVLEKDRVHEFRIQSRRPQMGGFRVYFNGA